MFYEYYDSKFGKIEVNANNHHLLYIKIVNEVKPSNPNDITSVTIKQLDEYFNNNRLIFDLPILYDEKFSSHILKTLATTEYGKTLSYKDLGILADSKAYQAIGSVMKNNNYPIIIPCHRIIKNDGSLGQYFYGSKMKQDLLLHEYRTIFTLKMLNKVRFSDEEIRIIQNHPILSKMFKNMPIISSYYQFKDVFAGLVSQILYQQVAFKTAFKQETLLAKLCDYDISIATLNKVSDKELIEIGLNGPRLRYIRNLTNYDFDYNLLYQMSEEEIYNTLIKIVGVGSWTIEMILIFALNKRNIISYKDLIIINGLKHLYHLDSITLDEFNELVKDFNGIETITSLNLWSYMENGYYLK